MRPTDSARALPAVLLIALALLLLARLGTSLWEAKHPPRVYDRVSWLAPAAAIDASRQHRRPILYEFSAEWCGPCKILEREVFSDRDRAAAINSMFVPAKVVDRQREEGANPALVDSLEKHYRIEGFPTLLAVTPEGEEVGRIVGYAGRKATADSLQTFFQRALRRRPGMTPGMPFPMPAPADSSVGSS
jgi:thiol:disulfide interchange protein